MCFPFSQNVDCFQIWDILKNYLSDISYGTLTNILKNTAIIDTRPTYLAPRVWHFYYTERLFLLKLLQYIIQSKDDPNHNYNREFTNIINDIGIEKIKSSLLSQFDNVLSAEPPPRKIQNEFSNDKIRQTWAESNLREQLAILQNLLLIAGDHSFTDDEFKKLFRSFKKHNFGKNQAYNEFLEERHREFCLRIMYMEISLFMVIVDHMKM